ncbi:MAG: hypothetical protein ACR2RB_08425 [Gammaproteobacteria bacterium]
MSRFSHHADLQIQTRTASGVFAAIALETILERTGRKFGKNWQRQRQTWDLFVQEMWITYRQAIDIDVAPPPPKNL